jgi:putative redox protein
VATIAAPAGPEHVAHLLADVRPRLGQGEARWCSPGVRSASGSSSWKTSRASVQESIKDLHKALLLFHAPLDDTVGIENASAIFLAAKHQSFVSLDGAATC